jgi:endonuclease G
VRADTASDAEVVGYLKPGEKAELVKTVGAWREIKLTDTTGFVPSSYTTVVPDGQPPPSTTTTTTLPMPEGANLTGNRHVLLGIPLDADPSDDYLIDREYWVASYNSGRLVPNWVSWELVASDLGSLKRPKPEPFAEDTALPSTMIHVGRNDYAGSGYDRGHMCPSADRNTTRDVNTITYLMTNMQPQLPDLNRYPWKALEDVERRLAGEGKQLQIIAGGVFPASPERIGTRKISVPSANFKIIVVMGAGEKAADVTLSTTVCSVIMPNRPEVKDKKWYEYLVSVDEIEKQTGYDFLRDVPDDVENVIEARVPTPQDCGAPASATKRGGP